MRFREIVAEAAEGKNLHLEHIEDLVFLQGKSGASSALQYINSVRDMLEHGKPSGSSITVKWDGAPAIFAGVDPSDGKFFVSTKSVFTQDAKLVKQPSDLAQFNEGPREKLAVAFKHLRNLGIQGVLQGDLMYTKAMLDSEEVDGEDSWIFQPNTITYAVPKDSKLGKQISASDMGIIFHTTYNGPSLPDMTASFGADVSELKPSTAVWYDDASYKDLSGSASLTPTENTKIMRALNAAAAALKTADFDAVSGDYKKLIMQYVNSRIRAGTEQVADPQQFVQDFSAWYKAYVEKDIAKLKNQSPDAPAVKARRDKIQAQNEFMQQNIKGIVSALAVYQDIIAMKNMLIEKLNKVDSIKTLIRTDTGYDVTNPEGFVAIGSEGGAVKLVARLQFSKNNFNAVKNWKKG